MLHSNRREYPSMSRNTPTGEYASADFRPQYPDKGWWVMAKQLLQDLQSRPLAVLLRRRFLVLLLGGFLLSLGALKLFVSYAERDLAADMTRTARNRLELYAGSLYSALNKHSYLPYILARHPSIRRLVTHGDNLDEVNSYLEATNAAAHSMEMFVLNATGLTIAASNWNNSESFVGHDYHYRPYFQETLTRGRNGYFAVGATTGKPGFFFSESIEDEGRFVGVMVVKVDLSAVQREWRDGGETVFITDGAGIVFLSSQEGWRYRATRSLDAATSQAMLYQRQYGNTLPKPIVMRSFSQSGAELLSLDKQNWLYSTRSVTEYGWTIWFLSPVTPLAQRGRTLWFIGGGGICLMLLLLLLARTLFAWRKARRVAQEAEEIRAVNLRLTEEIQTRKKVEAELLAAQDDLLHSGRMAALGQVAASVVHELSQPITSMSMFASSCRRLAQNEGHQGLADTAEHMLAMVQRIKSLIGQLKHFSRKTPGKMAPVLLREVLDNALTVLQFKQDAVNCTPVVVGDAHVMVMGDILQLEQVCINLLHNALGAVSMTPDDIKKVEVKIETLPDAVLLSVTDSGPGIDPAVWDKIFTPFFTTKKSGEGIGLGLAIVDNIVRSMRGEIEAHNIQPHGARFILRLPLAQGTDSVHG